MRIRCTESFYLDGGSEPVLKGEVFRRDTSEEDLFISTTIAQYPNTEIFFDSETLYKYFEVVQ